MAVNGFRPTESTIVGRSDRHLVEKSIKDTHMSRALLYEQISPAEVYNIASWSEICVIPRADIMGIFQENTTGHNE